MTSPLRPSLTIKALDHMTDFPLWYEPYSHAEKPKRRY
jgi:hypothetical protein